MFLVLQKDCHILYYVKAHIMASERKISLHVFASCIFCFVKAFIFRTATAGFLKTNKFKQTGERKLFLKNFESEIRRWVRFCNVTMNRDND